MDILESIKVPQSHVDFANAVASLAEKNGIAAFTMEYEPHWDRNGGEEWDHRVRGKARISYKDKDGRGRPCRNLGITFDATVTHVIESNQESCS